MTWFIVILGTLQYPCNLININSQHTRVTELFFSLGGDLVVMYYSLLI